ncbi:MAG: hypothetical protein VW082_00350 [Candidatus Nanopelagicales bacterium]
MTDAIDLSGKVAIAAVDFLSTRIYALDSPDHSAPERVVADDPRKRFHNVYHHHGNVDGTYLDDSDVYWHTLAEALVPATAIVLLGHGTGKANASHHLVTYLEKHRRDVADRIVADVRADIDDLTDEQVLRLGQHIMGIDPLRDHADNRRGAP